MPRPPMNLRPYLVALLLLGGSSVSLHAAEPQATFALKDGCLHYSVEQDGKGVAHACIRILDLETQKLAEGDSDDQVVGECFLPHRSAYLIGITIPGKKKESDIFILRSDGKTITPPRVSLSFSKPCCRVSFSTPPAIEPTPEAATPYPEKSSAAWILLGTSGAGMLMAAMMLMFFRRS